MTSLRSLQALGTRRVLHPLHRLSMGKWRRDRLSASAPGGVPVVLPAPAHGSFALAARTQPCGALWSQRDAPLALCYVVAGVLCAGSCVGRCSGLWGEPALGRGCRLTLASTVWVWTLCRSQLLAINTVPASAEPVQGTRGSSALWGCPGCCSEGKCSAWARAVPGGTCVCWGKTPAPGWALASTCTDF